MAFLKDFNIAFAKGDVEFLIENVTDDIVWNRIGDRKIEGKERFTEDLETMKNENVAELVIDQILTHGKEGAANGIMKMETGRKYAFSDFYVFKSHKSTALRSITSYVIEI